MPGLELCQTFRAAHRKGRGRSQTMTTVGSRGIFDGPRRHFTHSKVMAWVAFDRTIKSCQKLGLDIPVEHWCEIREQIHEDVCQHGFDLQLNSFVQSYGSKDLDASLLLLPLVGFLPISDPRVAGTVRAIECDLMCGGFVQRYNSQTTDDGLPPGEGAFLACSFWLVDNYVLMGRRKDAEQLLEKLLSLRNEVGLLSEEYYPAEQRLVGNFPQAFSHVALVNSVLSLSREVGPIDQRAEVPGSPPAAETKEVGVSDP
ncbi:MAG: glycoside hydrolase family 15 protein [Acidobacteriales bacterium]|nr:glycoside hydrolase family 15 protein [Terriglobales bacterium]